MNMCKKCDNNTLDYLGKYNDETELHYCCDCSIIIKVPLSIIRLYSDQEIYMKVFNMEEIKNGTK